MKKNLLDKKSISAMNRIIDANGSQLNKGATLYEVLVTDLCEKMAAGVIPDEDLEGIQRLEANLFTFHFSKFDQPLLPDDRDIALFLKRMLLLETEIIAYYSKDTATGKLIERVTATRSDDIISRKELENGSTRFELVTEDYTLATHVSPNGYRVGYINDQILFTKSGTMTIANLITLILVLNQEV